MQYAPLMLAFTHYVVKQLKARHGSAEGAGRVSGAHRATFSRAAKRTAGVADDPSIRPEIKAALEGLAAELLAIEKDDYWRTISHFSRDLVSAVVAFAGTQCAAARILGRHRNLLRKYMRDGH
jgi:DNA-binding protein Fis